MTRFCLLCLIGFLVACLAGPLYPPMAQDTSSLNTEQKASPRTWFGLEGGRSTSGGFTITMSASHVRSPHLFGLRFLGESPGKGFSEGFFEESHSELGSVYGRGTNWDWGHASLSTGIAVVWKETASESITWTTAGLPLQTTLYLTIPYRPVDWIGLQVGGHANINPEHSFGGATVGLVIGKLR